MFVDKNNTPNVPRAQILYGSFVYWLTIISAIICIVGPLLVMARVDNNILNPHYLFAKIWSGEGIDAVWQGAGFTGGHFYVNHLFTGDGFIQLGIVLGSSVALWGLLAAAWEFFKERAYIYTFASIFISATIVFAMLGIVKLK